MIRLMRPSDAAEVAALAGQLGYPSTPEQVVHRFAHIHGCVSVAEVEGRVVGFVHCLMRTSMVGTARVEIASLVVDEASRGKGIGSQLLAAAEEWGRAQGAGKARLLSRATRPDAHRLYVRSGYEITKTSYVFDKAL
jgi:GNAT superfamily N-acetyltransferase